jgi:hypothetical protein
VELIIVQYGGSPVKVGEEEYTLFRDHEYVFFPFFAAFLQSECLYHNAVLT